MLSLNVCLHCFIVDAGVHEGNFGVKKTPDEVITAWRGSLWARPLELNGVTSA